MPERTPPAAAPVSPVPGAVTGFLFGAFGVVALLFVIGVAILAGAFGLVFSYRARRARSVGAPGRRLATAGLALSGIALLGGLADVVVLFVTRGSGT